MSSKKKDVSVLLSTCPPEAAAEIATTLVEARLAACVNVVPGVQSIYRWDGAIEQADESLLVVKCAAVCEEETRAAIVRSHPYDVPEVISVDVRDGHPPYVEWVLRECGAGSEEPA